MPDKPFQSLGNIKTSVDKGLIDSDIIKFLDTKKNDFSEKAYIIAYKHHEVTFGLLENGKLHLFGDEPTRDNLKEMRIFNENAELYIWKYNNGFRWRFREDEKGDECEIYEEEHIVWGTKVEDSSGKVIESDGKGSVITESRGMKFNLPFDITEKDLPLKYKVRNYFNYSDDGLIQFFDARLVNFKTKSGVL